MQHVNDPDLAADMDAVHVPMNKLLRAAGLTEQPETEDESEPSQSWLEAFCRWFWSPRVAYAVAACVMVVAVISGRGPSSEKLMPQQVVLAEFALTRSGESQGVDDERVVILDAGAESVDLQVERTVDPKLEIRFRAFLLQIEADRASTVASSSDNRRFVPAPDGKAYPVYRVPAHLLRKGVTYELRFEPVDAEGNLMESSVIRSRFRVAD